MKLAAAALALLLGLPPAAAMAAPALEVTLDGFAGEATLRLGDQEMKVPPGTHLIDEAPPGRYALTAEAAAGEGETLLLGVADVTVMPGRTATAALTLREVDDAGLFCGACHGEPGAAPTASPTRIPRDLHPSGFERGGGGKVDCLTCHTAHRPTGRRRYVVEPFAAANDLCATCHDRGHARQTESFDLCLSCHSLRAAEVEPGTSLVSASSRTLPIMKSLGGNKVPANFGCTYCHSTGSGDGLKDALSDFGPLTSRHPVGYNFTSKSETFNEYLSTIDSATAGELDCIDCHDPKLVIDQSPENLASSAPYVNHADPGGEGRASNPHMLRAPERNAFCLGCHGTGASFAKGSLEPLSHGEGALAEHDGTPLKTSGCSDCHNAHSSAGALLFADGSESGAAIAMGDVADCTTVCHERGDSSGSFDRSGHGRDWYAPNRPMGFDCGSCHSVDRRHDGPGRDMLNFTVDERVSAFGSSLTSICYVCHSSYRAHPVQDGGAGCIDCHDEHGEGTGGGASIAMIPRSLPKGSAGGEETVFEGAFNGRIDFYRKDGKGLCDNAACHSGTTAGGTPLAPLQGLMKEGKHGGGDQAPNSDCSECHDHGGENSSWVGGK